MSDKFFYTSSIAFFGGIFIFSFYDVSFVVLIACLVLCLVSFSVTRLKKLKYGTKLFLIMALSFGLGAFRIEITKHSEHPLDLSLGSKVNFKGIICDEPSQRQNSQGLCFQPDDSADKILLSAAKSPQRMYGDRISITGKLESPKNFVAYENGPEFDYISYLAKDDIRYVMNRPKISVAGSNAGNRLIAGLIWIKSAFMARIEVALSEPQAALMGGLLLGTKGALPQEVNDNFKRSGLTHILVLSGSNVTVVAESLARVFSFLPPAIGQVAGAFSIILFALMTGASSTTVRATVMALIGLLARAMGRRYDVVRALVISAVVMLIQNPRILAFDISFQLSFLATIAVIFVSPLVKGRLSFVPEFFGMREILSMTLATQLFTFPFIFFKMGEISIIALIPNLLVLPVVPYAMLGGFIVGMLGFIHPVLAIPFAIITNLMLVYMLKITVLFSSFPFATIKATLGSPFLFVSYAVFTIILYFLWRQKNSIQQSPN